jgi:outer membrane protein assembly factor BamB/ABC-type phosphate/phosphonate transport system substrate-binding protein
MTCQSSFLPGFLALSLTLSVAFMPVTSAAGADAPPLTMVVMDPLAKELACACVKGFAQRDYHKLAAVLERGTGQAVHVEFSDSLVDSLKKFRANPDLVVVGKSSVVECDAKDAGWKCRAVARLTGVDGSSTLTGLFVVKAADPAKGLKDLSGRRVFFGKPNAAEKNAAAMAALRAAGVDPPDPPETRGTCNEAALDLLDNDASPAPAAVISSYALSLLEGCGSMGKGDLKVIGKTSPVPFVTVFLPVAMAAPKQQKILDLLLAVKTDAGLLKALESKAGFEACQANLTPPQSSSVSADWPDWRGPRRDGRVPWLPDTLPAKPVFVWKKACVDGCLAGLSVVGKRLIVAERDLMNLSDVVRSLDADTGEQHWRAVFPAKGNLDYGESPRAAPVIHDDTIYQLGAFGDLRCLALADGKLRWQRNLLKDFGAPLPTWGICPTPLWVDGLLIVNPGAPKASLAALDPATGETRWTTPGVAAGYGSFIAAELGGRHQVVGHDKTSLGGWDPKTGKRLWQLVPPGDGDFNVTTPLALDAKLLVATENNGTRMYSFGPDGMIIPEPVGTFADLAPTTATPVATRGRLFGTSKRIHCLDASRRLQAVWNLEDDSIGDHASLFASEDRVLIVTMQSELILLDATSDCGRIVSRLRLFEDDVESYSHPALVGTRLFLRNGNVMACVDLGSTSPLP